MQNQLNKLTVAVTLASAVLASSQAAASGFQVREQSAKALGNAMAGAAAGAEDVSYMTFNPAAIGNVDGTQVAGGISYIDANFELTDASAGPAGLPLSYDRGGSREGGEEAWVPSFAFKTQLDDRFDFGLSVSAPYGLSTEYDKNWIGRYHAIETDLQTIDIQPTLNYRATDRLNLAVGLRAQYADATLSNAIDLGGMSGNPALVGNADGKAEVTGDDWGYGYTLGALFQATDRTRLGISYRSEVDLTLEGDVNYSASNAAGRQILAGAQAMGQLRDAGGKADLTTPANMNLGVYHQLTDRFAVMANAEWTEWSSFDKLVVKSGGQDLSTTTENWDDTWAFSVGANYQLNREWLLRAGLGVDESPVPDSEHRTPRVPDADRRWATLGATWMPTPDLGVTAGYMRVFGDDGDIDQSGAKPENATRGDLSGTYEVDANVFALSVDYRF
ncbi:OmpP1/FadL family transporter [Halomonas elongata]|uniref:FadL family protein n=2 Tax=Halomonas elongata TaxID=2746 RepID=E1V963_HALED|nr:outer membrane protein transport protein [Halomonas elongata]MDL4861732.1 outer membrane protein transport protein [Halomonas elongata]OBX34618.1 47 kDa outer membrane protein precursor [Halomonas elongata]WBF17475.1 outer membrane protein transport protein [Halomonas elongata]WPU46314.1 outer membrane protein transport protein [Halomonas elongata DSM 2581]CBV43735.1 FadL family protein [Halomonas elongata DSM 2581]